MFDEALKNHLETSPGNAKYLSPQTQNEMIACCGAEIQDKIVQRIYKAKYFLVLADESLDISGTEQLSICIRYVSDEFEIKEDFLGFCPLEKAGCCIHLSSHPITVRKVGASCVFSTGPRV